jgi:ATP-dependent helicase/nuclease subunit A
MATVSASQLLEYETCPRRYYYHWYLRLPSLEEVLVGRQGASPDSLEEWELFEGGAPALSLSEWGWSPLLRGIVVHRVCERWTGTESILDRLHQVLEDFSFPKELRARAYEELADELVRYAESHLAEWLRRASPVWSEWPFYLRLKGKSRTWDVHGQVDKVLSVDGRMILVDYKTNRVAGQDVDRLAEHYRWQVQLYAWAVGRSLGPVEEAYLYFTDPGVLRPVDVRPATVEDTLARVDERLQMLSRQWDMEAYPFTEDPILCRVCPYRAICPGAVR